MESLHESVVSTWHLWTNSTHLTRSQVCVSWISPWTRNTCGFISRKPPALRLEESRVHFLLCLSSLASLCSLAANENQRGRRCFRVEAAILLCLTSLLPPLCHQAALSPTSLHECLCLIDLVQPQFCDRIQSKEYKWLLNAYNYHFNFNLNFYVQLT